MQTAVTTREPRSRSWIFALATLLVIATCIAIVRSARYAASPDVAAFGVTFDLCITIPALFYFFVVRTGAARPFTLIPLFVACLFVARFVVPHGQQQMLRQLGMLEAPLEIVVIAALAARARRAAREVSSEDFFDRFSAVVRGAFGNNRLAEVLVAETAVLYFALAGWRVPSPRDGITFHKRSGWGSICACIAVMIVAEGIGAHLLIQRWSTPAAWIWTAFDAYAILWLIGDWQAFRIRPAFVEGDTLHLRFGLRWSARVRRDEIVALRTISTSEGEAMRGDRTTLRLAILDAPTLLIETSTPVEFRGLLGLRRSASRVALLPDDADRLMRSLENAR